MAEKPTKPEENRVFDVAKPGTSTPETGSKPMVVGHKSITIDPTMKSTKDTINDDESSSKTNVESTPAEKKVMSPIENVVEEVQTDAPVISDLSPESEANEKNEPDLADDKNVKTEETNQVEVTASKNEVIPEEKTVDQPAEIVRNNYDITAKSDKSNESDTQSSGDNIDEVEQEFNELIKSKKYFLDIKPEKSSGSKKLLLILLVLLFGLLGAYVLADAEIIPGKDLLPKRFMEKVTITETVAPQPVVNQTDEVVVKDESDDMLVSDNVPGITKLDQDYIIKSVEDIAGLPEGIPESFSEYLTADFTVKSEETRTQCETDNVYQMYINKYSDYFVAGGSGACSAGGQVFWFLGLDEKWDALGIQEAINCSLLKPTRLTAEFIPTCLSDELQTTVANPNGTYAEFLAALDSEV